MTNNSKLLFAAAVVLGLALGYVANGKLVGDMMALRTIGMACTVLAAAEQAGQLSGTQADTVFGTVMKAIDKDRTAPVEANRARRCQASG